MVYNNKLIVYIPTNTQNSVLVTVVYDNRDHNLENLSGQSMHFTN